MKRFFVLLFILISAWNANVIGSYYPSTKTEYGNIETQYVNCFFTAALPVEALGKYAQLLCDSLGYNKRVFIHCINPYLTGDKPYPQIFLMTEEHHIFKPFDILHFGICSTSVKH